MRSAERPASPATNAAMSSDDRAASWAKLRMPALRRRFATPGPMPRISLKLSAPDDTSASGRECLLAIDGPPVPNDVVGERAPPALPAPAGQPVAYGLSPFLA